MIETKKIVCPSCGAGKRYEKGSLVCDYCGHKEELALQNATLRYEEFSDFEPTRPDKEFRCVSCGATFEAKAHFRSGLCPYCQTPLIAPGQNEKEAAYIIPFRFSPEEAYERLKKWIASLWFAPNDFKKYYKKYKKLKPYYFPAWIFSFGVRASYVGERGIDRRVSYLAHTKEGLRRRYKTVTDWYPVRGVVDLHFKDIYAFSYLETPMAARRAVYRLDECVSFDERMLAGQESYEYDTSSRSGFVAATAKVEGAIRNAIRRDIGGDRQRVLRVDRDYYDVKLTLAYLPVYWGVVEYRGKFYDLFVNAQTGEVEGERPYSPLKIVFAVLGGLLVLAVILFLLDHFGYIDISLPKSWEYDWESEILNRLQ
jgi:DNA-directed RNA polymerase subunit RPC12/RpoP